MITITEESLKISLFYLKQKTLCWYSGRRIQVSLYGETRFGKLSWTQKENNSGILKYLDSNGVLEVIVFPTKIPEKWMTNSDFGGRYQSCTFGERWVWKENFISLSRVLANVDSKNYNERTYSIFLTPCGPPREKSFRFRPSDKNQVNGNGVLWVALSKKYRNFSLEFSIWKNFQDNKRRIPIANPQVLQNSVFVDWDLNRRNLVKGYGGLWVWTFR